MQQEGMEEDIEEGGRGDPSQGDVDIGPAIGMQRLLCGGWCCTAAWQDTHLCWPFVLLCADKDNANALPVYVYGGDFGGREFLVIDTGGRIIHFTGSVARLRRLQQHYDCMQRSLDLGLIRHHRRSRLRCRMAQLQGHIRSVVDSMHGHIIHILLSRAKSKEARLVLVLPPLDLESLLRRGSNLSGGARRMLATLAHGRFLRRLERAVATLDNVVLHTHQACEDYTTRCCVFCSTHQEVGAARVRVCHNKGCIAYGVAVGRDSHAATAIRWRFLFADVNLDALKQVCCRVAAGVVAPPSHGGADTRCDGDGKTQARARAADGDPGEGGAEGEQEEEEEEEEEQQQQQVLLSGPPGAACAKNAKGAPAAPTHGHSSPELRTAASFPGE